MQAIKRVREQSENEFLSNFVKLESRLNTKRQKQKNNSLYQYFCHKDFSHFYTEPYKLICELSFFERDAITIPSVTDKCEYIE